MKVFIPEADGFQCVVCDEWLHLDEVSDLVGPHDDLVCKRCVEEGRR